MNSTFRLPLAVALCALVCSVAAQADEVSAGYKQSSIGLGLVATRQPYLGVSTNTVPVPWLVIHNDRLFVDGIVAGYSAVINDHYKLNLLVQPRFDHVAASDSTQLTGIQTRSQSVDGGVELELPAALGKFTIIGLHDLLRRSNGSSLALGWIYPHRFAGGFITSMAGVEWQNANLVNYYYGVSNAEARLNRTPYSAGGGLNAYLGVFYAHPFSDSWQWLVGMRYTRLSREISDSPLVESNYSAILIGAISCQF